MAELTVVLKRYLEQVTGDSLQFQAKFWSEGLDIYVPGNGIRFENGVHLDLTNTDSVTIGYTG